MIDEMMNSMEPSKSAYYSFRHFGSEIIPRLLLIIKPLLASVILTPIQKELLYSTIFIMQDFGIKMKFQKDDLD